MISTLQVSKKRYQHLAIMLSLASLLINCAKQGAEGGPGDASTITITNATCNADGTVTLTLTNPAAYNAIIIPQYTTSASVNFFDSLSCTSGTMTWTSSASLAGSITIPSNQSDYIVLDTCSTSPCSATSATVFYCTIYAYAEQPNVFGVENQQVECS